MSKWLCLQLPANQAKCTHASAPGCQQLCAAHLQVVAFPSKSDGLFVHESLIFRSDSNGEDLAGYAGAGLYDSITMDKTVTRKVDYGSDRCLHLVAGRGFATMS
jgi:hypothetical protein